MSFSPFNLKTKSAILAATSYWFTMLFYGANRCCYLGDLAAGTSLFTAYSCWLLWLLKTDIIDIVDVFGCAIGLSAIKK